MGTCWNCGCDNDSEIVNGRCTNCDNRQWVCFACGCNCDGMVIGFYGETLCETCYEKQGKGE